jgi:small-conductance mechanosensitive channel
MKFQAILEEKNLSIDQLPKAVQKKISDLEKILVKVEEYKNSEEVDEESLLDAQSKINDLDRDIEKALLRFNPEVYQKRLEVLNKIHKNNKKTPKAEAKEKEESVELKQELVEDKINELKQESATLNKVKEVEIEELEEVEDEDDIEDLKNQQLEAELDRLKRTVSKIENNTIPEDLSTSGEAQPKKMSKGLILMGVGAFLLTWGAVNFFKERKG